MNYLRLFETTKTFNTTRPAIREPWVSFTEDNEKVHFSSEEIDNNGYPYVDLGLPSGTLWATMNIGAKSITSAGKYFQWGDTVGYWDASHTRWNTSPFNDGQTEFSSSYFNAHKSEWLEQNVLKPEYDAAHVNMGGSWKMPTKEILQEMFSNTDHEWVVGFEGSSMSGMKFISRLHPSQYIFLPATAGMWNGYKDSRDVLGQIWGSTYDTTKPGVAYELFFAKTEESKIRSLSLYYGFNVRGVITPSQS